MGQAEHWQRRVEAALADLDVTIFNPRRDDWDSHWQQSIDHPQFRQQVEWELSAQERAALVAMYFAPHTKAPITLLELGLGATTGKLIVCCPDGFWRKGNVDVVCRYYGIPQVGDLDELIAEVRRRLCPAISPSSSLERVFRAWSAVIRFGRRQSQPHCFPMDLHRLKHANRAELEEIYTRPSAVVMPSGQFRGTNLLRLDTPASRRSRYWGSRIFDFLPYGIDFERNTWFFFSKLRIGRFRALVAPSRWRRTTVVTLQYAPSSLPYAIKSVLYDEVKPLTPDLCLCIGGFDGDAGVGDHVFFALQRIGDVATMSKMPRC